MSSPTGNGSAAEAAVNQNNVTGQVANSGTCSVELPDGSPCPAPLVMRSYCKNHSSIGDRDFQIFQLVHEHFEQDLREFWQRSNFYLVVDGLLVSAFASVHAYALQIILACAGLIISLFWLLVARSSIKWIALWRIEVRRIDRIVNRFQSFETVESQLEYRPWISASWLTQWFPAFFLLGWICIFLLSVFRVTSI